MDLAQFHRMEAQLLELREVREDIERTVAGIVAPTSSEPESFWRIMWDKPIYANNRIGTANRKIDLLADIMPGQWRTIGDPASDYVVTRVGKGSGATSFEVSGMLAQDLRTRVKIAPHRLFAIQSAASVLRGRVANRRNGLFGDLEDMSLEKMIFQLRSDGLQAFWGPITTLHFLTDMGLACKPDLHLVNSVHRLGGPAQPGVVPSERETFTINEFVHGLTEKAYGSVNPALLRRVDLLLLHADMNHETRLMDESANDTQACGFRS